MIEGELTPVGIEFSRGPPDIGQDLLELEAKLFDPRKSGVAIPLRLNALAHLLFGHRVR